MLKRYKNKTDKILQPSSGKGLSVFSESRYQTIEVGKLTDEEMCRFNLGPYSKKSTPGSISV